LEPDVKKTIAEEVSGMPIETARREIRWWTGGAPL
jgi:hypothetical protein